MSQHASTRYPAKPRRNMMSEDLRFSTVAAASVATTSFDGTYASPKPPAMNESSNNTPAIFAYVCTGDARRRASGLGSAAIAFMVSASFAVRPVAGTNSVRDIRYYRSPSFLCCHYRRAAKCLRHQRGEGRRVPGITGPWRLRCGVIVANRANSDPQLQPGKFLGV